VKSTNYEVFHEVFFGSPITLMSLYVQIISSPYLTLLIHSR